MAVIVSESALEGRILPWGSLGIDKKYVWHCDEGESPKMLSLPQPSWGSPRRWKDTSGWRRHVEIATPLEEGSSIIGCEQNGKQPARGL